MNAVITKPLEEVAPPKLQNKTPLPHEKIADRLKLQERVQ